MPTCLFCHEVLTGLDTVRGTCAECRVAIFQVLVDECGVNYDPIARAQMFFNFPGSREYRFMGSLGFGGKVHWSRGRLYVTCYREDCTPERRAAMHRANDRLATLVKED